MSLQLRQRPVRFSRRGHLHQRFAVQHDLIRDLADASQSRTMAVGDELGDPDRDIDAVADPDRFTEIERLRDVDGARTRQTRAGGSSLPTSTNRLSVMLSLDRLGAAFLTSATSFCRATMRNLKSAWLYRPRPPPQRLRVAREMLL